MTSSWKASPDDFATIIDKDTGAQIADFGSPHISEEESLRNFRLGLAAPEMLEALKDAHSHIADDKLRTRIGKLIIKAEEGKAAA